MTMPWFRLYAEIASDPVVQSLSFEDQRHYVMLLCLKCNGTLDKNFSNPLVRDSVIATALTLQGEALANVKQNLLDRNLIDEAWQPKQWANRQFTAKQDPTNAERQRKWRELHIKRDSNGNVTRRNAVINAAKISDSDTDSDKRKSKKGAEQVPLVLHDTLPKETWGEWIEYRRARRFPVTQVTLRKQLNLLSRFTTEEQREMIDTAIQAGWQGLFPSRGGKAAPRKFFERVPDPNL